MKIAFSDLHGDYSIWSQIRDYIDVRYTEGDEIYFLGDAIDRGPRGIDIMLEIMEDPRINYIVGNHELLLYDILTECGDQLPNKDDYFTEWWLLPYFNNGGLPTLENLYKYGEDSRMMCQQIRRKIFNLPYRIDTINSSNKTICLTHSGFTPWKNIKAEEGSRKIKDEYTWNREHIKDTELPFETEQYKDTYIVHGHTPVQTITKTHTPEIYSYAGGHKIDIDLGTPSSNTAAILDLDTFKPTYFKTKGE